MLYRILQPSSDIQPLPGFFDVLSYRTHQQVMVYGIKEAFYVHIQYPGSLPTSRPDLLQRLMR